MRLKNNKGLNSIEKVRTKIFFYSAIFTIIGELIDILIGGHPENVIVSGFLVIGIATVIVSLRAFKLINNTWANFIIVYFLVADVIITLFWLIGSDAFYAYFLRVSILLCVIVAYAGFNIGKYHTIIIGIISMLNYVIISFVAQDEELIKSIPVALVIEFAFILGMYHLVHNFIKIYDRKEELLVETENANKALTARKEELKEVTESKNALFSIIYHDLRNPFNTILGFNDLMEIAIKNVEIDKIEKYHPIIKNSSESAYELLKNLFDWARSQKDQLNFSPTKFLLVRTIDEVLSLVISNAKQKKISITKDFPEDHTIVADKNMIATVIRNLVTNAIKFTPKNGKITIGLESKGNKILYFVRDTGVGAPKEKLDKIFSGKQIESEPGTENEKGSGLGLNICKGFIEKHRGKIWAEPNKEAGITVYFTIGV